MTADGKTYEHYPWVTPLSDYRELGGYRIASRGDAIWKRPEGDYLYGRFRIIDLAFDSELHGRTRTSEFWSLSTPLQAGALAMTSELSHEM